MTLKNKVLLDGWILTASKVFRRDKNMREECKLKEQSIYIYKNLYKLMRIAPKLLKCRVNMTYFVKSNKHTF